MSSEDIRVKCECWCSFDTNVQHLLYIHQDAKPFKIYYIWKHTWTRPIRTRKFCPCPVSVLFLYRS